MKTIRLIAILIIASVLFCQRTFAVNDTGTNEAKDPVTVLESIECRGNNRISCAFIRSKLRLSLQRPIIEVEVQNARLRLAALSNFKSVDLTLEKGSEKGKVILIVEVVEADSLITEFVAGAGYVSSDQPRQFGGGSYYDDTTTWVSGRASYQNLFNSQKIVEVTLLSNHTREVQSRVNLTGGASQFGGQVSYIDPNLFGRERLFAAADIGHLAQRQYSDHVNGYYQIDNNSPAYTITSRFDEKTRITEADALVGYRFWNYSYSFLKYSHVWIRNRWILNAAGFPDGSVDDIASQTNTESNYLSGGFGWDSEDDSYFPTRGSVLSLTVDWYPRPTRCPDCEDVTWALAYKKNWAIGLHSVITAGVGGEPAGMADRLHSLNSTSPASAAVVPAVTFPGMSESLRIRYAYLMTGSDGHGNTRRSQWYLQLGAGPVELSSHGEIGGKPTTAGVTAGFRFESKIFGMVDLYAAGHRYWPR